MSTFGWSGRKDSTPAPRLEELKAGVAVTPNVQLLKPLARGAMGEVWYAEHQTLGTQVAVKFITSELAADDSEIVERFQREARLAAQIKSPYVVHIHDFGITKGGSPYIVMEHLEGESLGQRLERTGWLSFDQVAQVVTQMAKALSAAHTLGIVHRDIKPDNIHMLSTDEGFLCKVLDFGIAKQTREAGMRPLTEVNAIMGTPEFMSPEQIMNAKDVDHQADLWGLAVVAYCALTGAIPFDGDNLGELCVSILQAKYKPPSTVRPECAGTDLDGWFQRAFAAKPNERFSSAKEMGLAFVYCMSSPPGHLIAELEQSGDYPGFPEPTGPGTVVGLGPPNGQPPVSVSGNGYVGFAADSPTRPGFRERKSGARLGVLIAVVGAALIIGGAGLFMLLRSGSPSPARPASLPSTQAETSSSTRATSQPSADPTVTDSADSVAADAGSAPPADGSDAAAAGSTSVRKPSGGKLVPVRPPPNTHGTKTKTDKEDPGF